MRYQASVFIGRFQPLHLAHLKEIKRSLTLADKLVIVIGSYRSSTTPKNPFTAEQREAMIRASLSEEENERISCVYVRDYLYNDTQWFSDVGRLVDQAMAAWGLKNATICLTGCNKDTTSYYIASLPDHWKREIIQKPEKNLSATGIREKLFEGVEPKKIKGIPLGVRTYLEQYKTTEAFTKMKSEYEHYKSYRKNFESLPYPPVFVTTDAVVIKNGHVLVVERGINPGKGLLGLPGGHLDVQESILDSTVRELKEETKINVNKDYLKTIVSETKVFDHVARSLRGRTITHGSCFKLPDGGPLPEVKGGDDAKHAFWIPIIEAYERCDEFFEDHIHIINYFTRRY
ncbi:MAG: adenylyltransferase/cytidyltransferase family protein [Pseudobacteriovorax sp.]|nr:adenylyltransferase/cytidyltransferase family protein [Pseudobacteriovorax sp.]